jgi:phage gp29-like protein
MTNESTPRYTLPSVIRHPFVERSPNAQRPTPDAQHPDMNPLTTLKNALHRRKPPAAEMAWGGAALVSGILAEEHNADLKGARALQAATQMRRTSAQVRATMQAVGLPLRSTAWSVEPPKDPGAAEREAAELLQANLFGGMETSWDDLLREACLAIYYGFRAPELVWEERAGLLALRKVASRSAELVERWLYDERGRLVGYLYGGARPVGRGLEDTTGGSPRYERIAVPLEKSLHFVYDRENDSPAGFGLWRSMYPHWYILDACYRVVSVGIERSLLGLPYGEMGDTDQQDDADRLLTILQRIRAAKDAAFVLRRGQKVAWLESARNPMDAMPFIQHQAAQISLAGLCQFLNLGMQAVGTQAVGAVHAELFETAQEANARWIEQTVNTQLVRRWCAYNYGDGLRCPRVTHRPIRSRDPGAWAQALSQFVTAGLFHPQMEDEEYLRAQLELPAIPQEARQARTQPGARTNTP